MDKSKVSGDSKIVMGSPMPTEKSVEIPPRNIEIYRLLNYRVFLGNSEERNAYLTTSFSKLT